MKYKGTAIWHGVRINYRLDKKVKYIGDVLQLRASNQSQLFDGHTYYREVRIDWGRPSDMPTTIPEVLNEKFGKPDCCEGQTTLL